MREGVTVSAIPNGTEKDQARAELEDVLAYHGGDALAAVESLLTDCRVLRTNLAIYDQITSKG